MRPSFADVYKRQHVGGRLLAGGRRLERGHEALQHERGLAGARHARDGGEPPARDVHGKGLHGVERVRFQMDAAQVEHVGGVGSGAHVHGARS